MKELAAFKIENFGPYAEHNYPCPVCSIRPAVFDCQMAIFEPCWQCQEDGYRLIVVESALQRFLWRAFFKDS